MVISSDFTFVRMPEIHFGPGSLSRLPGLIHSRGNRALLVTGAASFLCSSHYEKLARELAQAGIVFFQVSVSGEPSPTFVDVTVDRYRGEAIDCVIGIGGGSVLDAGKAISAMLPQDGSVAPFLECFDTRKHDGRKLPYIAVPTSSGTGAEATKNAVLSEIGDQGYKSSLRHDNFVPDIALLDPELTISCSPEITAACGLDTLTQLLEAYVSTKASPISDALALSGLEHFSAGFIPSVEGGQTDIVARSHMAYAALMSGVTLANAGLGVVHGFAGPIGGFFPIPHGVVCGTLIGEATRINIQALRRDVEKNRMAIEKYARVGALLSGNTALAAEAGCDQLVQVLLQWIERTRVPRLGDFHISRADFPRILDKTNNKNSPVTLSRDQMAAILEARL